MTGVSMLRITGEREGVEYAMDQTEAAISL